MARLKKQNKLPEDNWKQIASPVQNKLWCPYSFPLLFPVFKRDSPCFYPDSSFLFTWVILWQLCYKEKKKIWFISKSDRYNFAFEPSMYKPEWVAKSPSQRNIIGTIKITLNHNIFNLPFLSGEGRDFFSEYVCLKEFKKLQQINSTSASLIVLVNNTS